MTFGVGDDIPSDLTFDLDFPPTKVSIADYTKDKKVIIMGLPGAFTPTWSSRQIPGYLKAQDELKALGVNEVMLYCVNDAAVMKAWKKDQNCADDDACLIQFYGDPSGAFTKAADVEMTHPGPQSKGLFGRCKRFILLADHGKIVYKVIAEDVDFDPAGDDFPEKVLPDQILPQIKKYFS